MPLVLFYVKKVQKLQLSFFIFHIIFYPAIILHNKKKIIIPLPAEDIEK